MLIRLLGINFGEISIVIHTLLFKKMRLKMYFTKWRPFCLGLDVLIGSGHQHHQTGDLWKASLFTSIKSNFVCIKVVVVVNWKPIYFVMFIFQTWLLCRVTHWNGNDKIITWWRHQMETFSALLAICVGNSPVTGEFPAQRPVTWSFDAFLDLRLNKRLNKQSRGWWFETQSRLLWRHRNVIWV